MVPQKPCAAVSSPEARKLQLPVVFGISPGSVSRTFLGYTSGNERIRSGHRGYSDKGDRCGRSGFGKSFCCQIRGAQVFGHKNGSVLEWRQDRDVVINAEIY